MVEMITVDMEEHLSGGEARCLTPSHSSPALRARPLVGCGWWYPVRVSSRGVRRRPTVRVHGRRGRRRLVQCYKGDLRLSEGHFCRAYKTLGERAHTESTQRRGARAYRVRIILWAGGSRVEVGRDQARRGEISLEGRTRPGQPRLGRSHFTRFDYSLIQPKGLIALLRSRLHVGVRVRLAPGAAAPERRARHAQVQQRMSKARVAWVEHAPGVNGPALVNPGLPLAWAFGRGRASLVLVG